MLSNWPNWDRELFFLINSEWTNPFLDQVFPWWRDMTAWYPLYLFLLVYVLVNFPRQFLLWLLFIVITISLSDQLSSSFLKNWIQRLRPCQDPEVSPYARLLLDHCSGGFSFTSSHACNHFAAAIFFHKTLHKYFSKWSLLFFFWAATISYGQVYTGVHYPLDILAGGLAGTLIGWLMFLMYKKMIHRLGLETTVVSTRPTKRSPNQ
jgi:undecaprenyl-diphosphatase